MAFSRPASRSSILDFVSEILKDLNILVVLLEFFFRHHNAAHEFAVRLGLKIELNIVFYKLFDLCSVDP